MFTIGYKQIASRLNIDKDCIRDELDGTIPIDMKFIFGFELESNNSVVYFFVSTTGRIFRMKKYHRTIASAEAVEANLLLDEERQVISLEAQQDLLKFFKENCEYDQKTTDKLCIPVLISRTKDEQELISQVIGLVVDHFDSVDDESIKSNKIPVRLVQLSTAVAVLEKLYNESLILTDESRYALIDEIKRYMLPE